VKRVLFATARFFLPTSVYWHGSDVFDGRVTWQLRTAMFGKLGLQNYRRFASRFDFSPQAKLFLCEHPAQAIQLVTRSEQQDPVLEIVSYDITYGCDANIVTGVRGTPDGVCRVTNDNWLAVAQNLFNVRVEVVLPQWLTPDDFPLPPPCPPASLTTDAGCYDPVHFDAVVLAHTHFDVPPHTDPQYNELCTTWPPHLQTEHLESLLLRTGSQNTP
jgi:hypothetical protein